MQKITEIAERFRQDEGGAALIEYTILLGIITVATITLIIAIGGWIQGQWSTLNSDVNP